MILKLTNGGKFVFGTDDNGNMVSYSIEAEEYKQWLAKGNTPKPEFTEDELKEKLKSDIKTAIQNLLDTEAKEYGYDDIVSAASYKSATPLENQQDEKFRLEGNAFYAFRSACWSTSISYMIEVGSAIDEAKQSGVAYRLPTVEEVLTKMPTLDLSVGA